MLTSIKFNDELFFDGAKVRDVIADGVLVSKLHALELSVAQT